jgi:S-adenosylmethionine:tRNA ribosyltransferase-isomerase
VRIDQLDYALPEQLIASRPTEERDGARLLVMGRGSAVDDRMVRHLAEVVSPGSLLVVNDTRVIPARLFGHKASGGRVEILLVGREAGREARYKALGRSSKGLKPGTVVAIEGDLSVTVIDVMGDGTLLVDLDAPDGDVPAALERAGHIPLPPYIGRADDAADRVRYQTIFAKAPGAVAAPTAGLHLSDRVLGELDERDVEIASVTLHVSLGTFQPVKVDDLDEHPMHEETFVVPTATVAAIARARDRGRPVVAVGTTSVRALESAADPEAPGHVRRAEGQTRLLIQPGYAFRVVDALLTNFHLPKSTLLALVCAFGGRDRVLAAYAHAVAASYRFFSYGDAMFLRREDAS